jgi:hypothetical protein
LVQENRGQVNLERVKGQNVLEGPQHEGRWMGPIGSKNRVYKKMSFSPVLMSNGEIWVNSMEKTVSKSRSSIEGPFEQGGGIARPKGSFLTCVF